MIDGFRRILVDGQQNRMFLKFVLVGALNTAFGYLMFVVLMLISGSTVWLSLVASYACGIVFNYFTHGRLVFGARGWGRLPVFVFAYVSLYAVNLCLLELCSGLGLSYFSAQAALLPLMAVASFVSMRLVFQYGQEKNLDHNPLL